MYGVEASGDVARVVLNHANVADIDAELLELEHFVDKYGFTPFGAGVTEDSVYFYGLQKGQIVKVKMLHSEVPEVQETSIYGFGHKS